MKLSLQNIGKISTASVEINGITVIAGENNTGKSTVGRALFAVFNSFYNIQAQIERERTASIENLLDRMYFDNGVIGMRAPLHIIFDTNKIAAVIVARANEKGETGGLLDRDEILETLEQYDETSGKANRKERERVIRRIEEVLKVPEEEILRSLLDKRLKSEFNGQICNIFAENPGRIELEIKQQSLSVFVGTEGVSEVANAGRISLRTEAVYLDDPFVLDETGLGKMREKRFDHRTHLQGKISANQGVENLLDEILTRDKLENIYSMVGSVCDGDVIRSKSREFGYRRKNSDKVLNVRNLSTGLKTFVILKMLLENGTIEPNGTIILDEPEIHLHPEWQLLFAELIVLLQKEFGLHVLLNTHSPYFLRAIQVYSAKYERADVCKYYLSEGIGDQANITDVTEHIDRIYVKLSRPLQELEDERWENE